MKAIFYRSWIFLLAPALLAGASQDALRYTLEIQELKAEPISSRVIYAGREWYGATSQSYVGVTLEIPEKVEVFWSGLDDPTPHHAVLDVRKNVPPQFRPGDSVVIEFQRDKTVKVGFEVALSEMTRRVIYHPLSKEELERHRQDDELVRAFQARDTARIAKALAAGAEPYQTWRPSKQVWPYVEAIDKGWVDVLQVFIAAGFGPREEHGQSILISPVTKGRPEVVKLLLVAGADPNYVGPLCPRPQTRDRVWGCNGSGYPIVYSAIHHNDVEIARLLIEHGAVVDRQLKDGTRILDWVGKNASPEMRELVEKAARSQKAASPTSGR